ncbi:RAD55 family ATPase [Methanolobus profundi]|uniref:RecA-superfamily ATPase, KaiC/GvpD/RAD55 family n=1 Tax=Methanolobus profundi TaxID=487685 RepID=A0A1I4QWN8_9EURY|nr:recombinase RecA [Methanolobus profundi]SFM44421.1 RecA-superfamily ATPase, KaiC/GvpD/RAD55 family [Methanolobus profundi]
MSGYSLGIKELDDLLGGIREGTNLMMIGPPMSRKDDLLDAIIFNSQTPDGSAIIVSTREPGERVLGWFEDNGMSLADADIGVVDCVTKTLGMAAADTDKIKRASSPVDLTGIGVKISQFFEEMLVRKQKEHIHLCINSLSTILMYSNIQTVFRFLHVFTGRVKAANGFGLYVVEDEMHDAQTIATLKQLFDGMIEIKAVGDSYAMRVVGLTSKPTPWFEYSIEGTELSLKRT